ncbi:MAG: hypothetical protein Q4E78_09800 [Eubacteriales bacterium]|nr:hypothetical protein [Eubacteriales bacterium]
MEYGIVVALICAILTYINLDENLCSKIKILNKNKDKNCCHEIGVSKNKIYIITSIVFLSSFVACVSIIQDVSNNLNIIKMNIALICLAGAAAMDYREHRIPNIYPLVLSLSAIICLGIGYFNNQQLK